VARERTSVRATRGGPEAPRASAPFAWLGVRRREQPAITASFPPSWQVHLGTTRSVAVGAAGLAVAALAAIVAVGHIEVLAVTAATAAAKVRFNFPGLINFGCHPRLPQ
jgi:hypothetical protein